MKYRQDFVTNSSSSSFIVAFRNKKELKEVLERFAKEYGISYADRVLYDILSPSNHLTYKQAYERVEMALDELSYYKARQGMNTGREHLNIEEFERIREDFVKEGLKEFEKSVNHRGIFAEIEYSDQSSIGSDLEHKILPKEDFVVAVFNNH